MELWKQNGSMSPTSARSRSQQRGTEIHYTCDHDAHVQFTPYQTGQLPDLTTSCKHPREMTLLDARVHKATPIPCFSSPWPSVSSSSLGR
jgi:hypothetical protein